MMIKVFNDVMEEKFVLFGVDKVSHAILSFLLDFRIESNAFNIDIYVYLYNTMIKQCIYIDAVLSKKKFFCCSPLMIEMQT